MNLYQIFIVIIIVKNMNEPFINALVWWILIWLMALVFSGWLGRVMWISWIIKWVLPKSEKHSTWRWLFLIWLSIWWGLYLLIKPEYQILNNKSSFMISIISWILVWIWTSMSNWCTSWHAVCWIGRLSIRSIIATITFMISWIISVYVFNNL